MSDRLLALRLFTRVARSGSFSRVGREFGLSQPSVSRILAALEREIGTSLLTRTTRGVKVTEAGTDYLAHVEPILDALDEADHAARGTGELRGVLRAAMSTSFALREVVPRLPEFVKRHPALRLELVMSDQRQDLLNEGVDVALRFGALTDSTAIARRIATVPRLLAAAPAYLQRAGTPRTPDELGDHAIIFGPASYAAGAWSFRKAGKVVSVRVESRLHLTVHEATIAAAVVGLGIVSGALLGCRTEIASGALVQVLPDWEMDNVDVHALFAAGRAAKPSARAFADYLASALAG